MRASCVGPPREPRPSRAVTDSRGTRRRPTPSAAPGLDAAACAGSSLVYRGEELEIARTQQGGEHMDRRVVHCPTASPRRLGHGARPTHSTRCSTVPGRCRARWPWQPRRGRSSAEHHEPGVRGRSARPGAGPWSVDHRPRHPARRPRDPRGASDHSRPSAPPDRSMRGRPASLVIEPVGSPATCAPRGAVTTCLASARSRHRSLDTRVATSSRRSRRSHLLGVTGSECDPSRRRSPRIGSVEQAREELDQPCDRTCARLAQLRS